MMGAPDVADVVVERIGVAHDLATEVAAELVEFGQQTTPTHWGEAGTLAEAIADLRSALVHVRALTR
jgi:hypothetical protein